MLRAGSGGSSLAPEDSFAQIEASQIMQVAGYASPDNTWSPRGRELLKPAADVNNPSPIHAQPFLYAPSSPYSLAANATSGGSRKLAQNMDLLGATALT